jgi:membrane protein involved in colicin uptake
LSKYPQEKNLNLHTAELRAQAAEEAQRAAEEAQRAAEEAQQAAEEAQRAAEADVVREAEGRHAVEVQIAKLQEQLQLLTPDGA